jgi:hypothetical protein
MTFIPKLKDNILIIYIKITEIISPVLVFIFSDFCIEMYFKF